MVSKVPCKPVRVALLGYGYASKTFHAPLIDSVSALNLHVISSSQPEKVLADVPSATVVADPYQAIQRDDVDLVVIATPNTTHYSLAKAALHAGKHVVVDKPFTLTSSEAKDLGKLAASSDKLLSVFHNRRWDADFLTVKKLISEGSLGQVVHFESHFDRFRPSVVDRWREQNIPGSGLWYDLGPHLLDQALQLFGAPETLQADLQVQREGGQAIDYFHVQLGYGPLRVLLHGSMLVASPPARFVVHGTKGSYIKYDLDTQEASLKAGHKPGSPGWGLDPNQGTLYSQAAPGSNVVQQTLVENLAGSYETYYQQVAEALLNPDEGALNPVTPAQATLVMELLELGVESSQLGQKLQVRPKV
mmetsp:Transcript_26499/g.57818  ORF Transcript_26499/g.57818 Transcript_26499/m.57818 type:complete len:361 (-) Transcript_26499:569-1651(-)|eukprot:CAMPEP_0202910270 /NCGR_PEP_ID=MMETSP1392-20130828/51604_1 /ASSEMBLY_ACC=CAM_ASM_000868 /TAXON_ID=225041 /ORGANISM="Chlamydomonas chlamydogama, Strain SAG 11-48b" /LENGTH=360 /DNA_ID=CAMNT_0049600333 /DNA_START=79 /DNA_END=1161 /DNA_ORIENTATION=+